MREKKHQIENQKPAVTKLRETTNRKNKPSIWNRNQTTPKPTMQSTSVTPLQLLIWT